MMSGYVLVFIGRGESRGCLHRWLVGTWPRTCPNMFASPGKKLISGRRDRSSRRADTAYSPRRPWAKSGSWESRGRRGQQHNIISCFVSESALAGRRRRYRLHPGKMAAPAHTRSAVSAAAACDAADVAVECSLDSVARACLNTFDEEQYDSCRCHAATATVAACEHVHVAGSTT